MSPHGNITFIQNIPHKRYLLLQDREVSPRATCTLFQGYFHLLLALLGSLSFALFLPHFPPFTSLFPIRLPARLLCSSPSLQLPLQPSLSAASCCPSLCRSLSQICHPIFRCLYFQLFKSPSCRVTLGLFPALSSPLTPNSCQAFQSFLGAPFPSLGKAAWPSAAARGGYSCPKDDGFASVLHQL